jgi:hypothetical protein
MRRPGGVKRKSAETKRKRRQCVMKATGKEL